MRIMLSVLALFTALAGIYAAGAGVFAESEFSEQILHNLAAPCANSQPLGGLMVTISAALGFFSLAMVASGGKHTTTPLKATHVFLTGGTFSIITAAGLGILLYTLCRQGAPAGETGLVFSLAAVQACLGMVLGGCAVVAEKSIRKFAVPVFVIGLLEASLSSAVLFYGSTL